MQPEHAKIENLLDQQSRAFDELLLVAHEGKNHSHRDRIVEREPRRQVYRDDVLEAEDGVIEGLEADLGASKPHVGANEVGIAIEPLALTLVLAIEQLEALHGAHGFDEGRAFMRPALYDRFIAPPERAEQSKPDRGIEQEREQCHEPEHGAVYEHHDQRERSHHAIDDAEYH